MDTVWENKNEKNIPKFSLNGETKIAKITSVYDGDTVKACFSLGEQFYIWNCRISGVDTPELRTKINSRRNMVTSREMNCGNSFSIKLSPYTVATLTNTGDFSSI